MEVSAGGKAEIVLEISCLPDSYDGPYGVSPRRNSLVVSVGFRFVVPCYTQAVAGR